jgi:hypothetical protein
VIAAKSLMSRRRFVAGASAFSAAAATSGCAIAPSGAILAESIIFLPAIIGLTVNFLSTYVVDPLVDQWSKLADEEGANKDVCMAAAQLVGPGFVERCLRDKVAIWASENVNVENANSFSVELTSHSSNPKDNGGQLEFELLNVSTGRVIGGIVGDSFELLPYDRKKYVYGPYKGFRFDPGATKIKLTSAPNGVTVEEVEVAVLPMSIQVV